MQVAFNNAVFDTQAPFDLLVAAAENTEMITFSHITEITTLNVDGGNIIFPVDFNVYHASKSTYDILAQNFNGSLTYRLTNSKV